MSSLESLVGSMTVAELARLANKTVEAVVRLAFGHGESAARQPRARASAKPRRKTAAKPKREPRGSVAADKVLAFVAAAKGAVSAATIRSKVGGSAAQVRSALKGLAEAGKIKISGKRRGTRYTAK